MAAPWVTRIAAILAEADGRMLGLTPLADLTYEQMVQLVADEVAKAEDYYEVCGERFGATGVCDMPKGHDPIAPPHWMHSENIR